MAGAQIGHHHQKLVYLVSCTRRQRYIWAMMNMPQLKQTIPHTDAKTYMLLVLHFSRLQVCFLSICYERLFIRIFVGSWNPTLTMCGYAQDLARKLVGVKKY